MQYSITKRASNLISKLRVKQTLRAAKRARVRRAFRIESLEERALLATVVWESSVDGNWNDPQNWVEKRVPGANDDVIIPDIPNASPRITFNTGTISLRSLEIREAFVLAGGTFSATNISQLGGSFTITGGTLNSGTLAAGTVNVTAGATFGNTTVGSGAQLQLSNNATLRVSNSNTFTVNGSANFTKGSTLTLEVAGGWTTSVIVNGSLTATETTFTETTGSGTTRIVVGSGGRLIASDSSFSTDELRLNEGAILNSGDWQRNSFLKPIWTPAALIRNMYGAGADNKQFQDVNLIAGTFASGTLNLTAMGTMTTASLRYLVDGNLTLAQPTAMNVAAGIPLRVNYSNTFTINGTANFDKGSSLILEVLGGWITNVTLNGTLTATEATFTETTGSGISRIVVGSGGRLTASDSSFSTDELRMNEGAILNPGDWQRNSFLKPIWTPAALIRSMYGAGSDNKQFQDVNLIAGTFASGTLNLTAMGTVTTASLRYLVDGNLTLAPPTAMNVAAGIPLRVNYSNTFTINGTANFDKGSSLILEVLGGWITNVTLNGTLTATEATFTETTGSGISRIVVGNGGRLIASDSSFSTDELRLNEGAILNPGDWQRNSFFKPIWTPAALIRSMYGAGSDNKQFQDVNLIAGTFASGTLNLTAMGTVTTASLRYLVDGNLTLAPPTAMNVASGIPLRVNYSNTFTINGTANFDKGSSLILEVLGGWITNVTLNGTLTATEATFTETTGSGISRIVVGNGGRLIASDSSFSTDELRLNEGAILNPGDWQRNNFFKPIWTPAALIRSMYGAGSDNKQFQDVNLIAGTLASGTLNLTAMGTVTTANLRYLVDGNLTLAPPTAMNVAAGIPLRVNYSNTFTINGTANFDKGSSLTLEVLGGWITNVTLNGTLTATEATFTETTGSGTSRIVVGSGGRLTASDSSFSTDELRLNEGAILNPGDWQRNSFFKPIWTPAALLRSMYGAGSDNKQFQDVNLIAGTFATGTLNLTAMGTVTTADLRYLIDGNLTLAQSTAMNVASGIPLRVNYSNTFTINGSANFDKGSSLTLEVLGGWITNVTLNGTLTVTEATFTETTGSGTSRITIGTGGRLTASNTSLLADEFSIASGATVDFTLSDGTTKNLGGGGISRILTNYRSIDVRYGSTLTVPQSLRVGETASDTASLKLSYGSTLAITGSLLGKTRAAANFVPQGRVLFNGTGTSANPQLIEIMSADRGNNSTGFSADNFAYGKIELANNTYVRLTNIDVNNVGAASEALYVNSLVVPAGTTLDLNNQKIYVRSFQRVGNIINGTVNVVSDGGPLAFATPTPGTISAGQSPAYDEWTFTARQNAPVMIQLNPGLTGTTAALPTELKRARVEILNASNSVVNFAQNDTDGAIITLESSVLVQGQPYKIRVYPHPSVPASTGNYVVTLVDSTSAETALSIAAAADSVSKTEGNSGTITYNYTVTRFGDLSSPSSVSWAVSGTSSNPALPSDFVGGAYPGGTINFAASESIKSIQVVVNSDTDYELDEAFTVTLSNPTNRNAITVASVTSTILNDDQPQFADLIIGSITPPVAARSGQRVNLAWTEKNDGPVAFTGNWSTSIRVIQRGTNQVMVDRSVPFTGTTLAPAASVARNFEFDLPDGTAGVGNFDITITVDSTNTIRESNVAGTAETNNSATSTFASTLADYPAISVSQLIVPANIQLSVPFTVSWTVLNSGPGQLTKSIRDRVYLSTDDLIDNSDRLLATVDAGTKIPLASGASYTQSSSFTLPLDPLIPLGAFKILVQTDALNDQFELNESDNTRTAPTNVALPPLPDLVVNSISTKAVAVAGQSINVTWTIKNQGGAAANGPWTDRVSLSDDGVIGSDLSLKLFAFTDAILPNGSVERTQEVQLPSGISGVYRLVVTTDLNNTVQEFNREDNNSSIDDVVIVIDARPAPNLVVDSVTSLTTGLFSGQSATIDWVVKNIGNASTNSDSWIDRVYLSEDGVFSNDDVFLGQVQNPSYLNVGDGYRSTLTTTLPQNAVGDRKFIVVTDATNRVAETGGEDDNTRASATTTIQLTPPPDLIVTRVVSPSDAFEGEPIVINYTVRNQGTGATRTNQWKDQVYLSFNGKDIDIADTLLKTMTHDGDLAANGAEYSLQQLSVLLPEDKVGDNAFLIVRTDSGNVVYEHAFEGNNDTATENPIRIFARPRPDLIVESIKPISAATAGQPLSVSYVVTNASVTPTRQNSWQDSIYLSSDKALSPQTDILLGVRSRTRVLSGETSESLDYRFTLPNTLEGNYYLIVATDSSNAVPEFLEDNNVLASTNPIEIAIDPPDLNVTGINFSGSAKTGRDFVVNYSVNNIGRNVTPNTFWNDAIYLSTDNQWDATDLLLDQRQRNGALGGGQAESRSVRLRLPTDRMGPMHLIVKSDSTDLVYELNNGNNILSVPVTIEDDRPDLNVLVFEPRLGNRQFAPGTPISFDYEVENRGIGPTFGRSWTDRVVMSSDLVAGNIDDITLANFTSPQDLNVNRSYFRLGESLQIPSGTPEGLYRLFFITDAAGIVTELNENNNVVMSADFSVTNTPVVDTQIADLQITALTTPATIGSGQNLPVTWTVRNTGIANTSSDSWHDSVYLSLDNTIDDSDILIGNFTRYGGLAPNATYTRQIHWPIDIDLSGNYFVIIQTDASNKVLEGVGESNNKRVSSPATMITLSPTPDLRVANLSVPAQAFSGRSLNVGWTIENAGAGKASRPWTDSFYLSLDQIFDRATDIPIGFMDHSSDLPAAQSYSANANFLIPAGLGGAYYVFVVTDSTNRVYERQLETNNTSFQPITLTHLPPADLIVGDITIPANSIAGEKASISFTIQNAGQNAARGGWYDSIYLSSDDKWDIDDANFGRVFRSADVPANSSYAATLEAPLPGVVPGNYKVIIRSDIRNNLVENDESNNLKASLNAVTMDATALTLGVAKSGTITTNGAVYYKVSVPAGETVAIEFDSASAVGSTELYASFDKMPRRSQSDFVALLPFQTDQRIVISSTEGGTYYILAYGNDVENGSSAFSILARIVPFSVFDTHFGQGGTAGNRTIVINGAKFDRTVTASLVDSSGKSFAAVSYTRPNDTRLYATFDLRTMDIGNYSVRFNKGTTLESFLVPNSLDVVYATISTQPISLTRPDTFNRLRGTRPPAVIPALIGWRNSTLNDIPVPLIHFSATDPFAMTLADANAGNTISATEFLGFTESDGPKDIMLAGETASASFYIKPVQVDANSPLMDIHYVTEYFYDDATAPYNWDFDLSQLDLSYLTDDEAIDAIRAFKSERGETVGALRKTLMEGLQRSEDLSPSRIADASRFLLQDAFDRFVAQRYTSVTGKVSADSLAIAYKGLVVTLSEVGGSRTFSTTVLADGTFVFPKLPAIPFAVSVTGGAVKAPSGLQIQLTENQHAALNIALEVGPKTQAIEVPTRVPVGTSPVSAPWITRPGKIDEVLTGNALESVLPKLNGIPYRVELIGGAPVGFFLNSDGSYRFYSSEITAFVVHYDLVIPDQSTRVGRLFNSEIRSRGVIAITLKNNATRDVRALDPNDIIGPVGYGPEQWVSASERLGYTIRFENDPVNASAAAQTVQIEQTLDSDLDPSSFQFGDFGFGGRQFKVPTGRQTLNLDLDLKAELGIIVRVFGRIDAAQRKVSWTFSSISPETGMDTTNPDDGFLPLNIKPPEGDGFVSYSIRARRTALSGSVIHAQARIIFDGNLPIDTPEIFNTLDATKPVSSISKTEPIPSEQRLLVKWAGNDGEVGAGLSMFDVYVSENGSRYRPWLQGTTLVEAIFPTQQSRTYDFVTIAKDNVGNGEDESKIPDAHRPIADIIGGPYNATEGAELTLQGAGRDPDPGQTVTYEWDFDYDGFSFNVDSTEQNPKVIFRDGPSIRNVGLRVKDNSSEGLYSIVAVTSVTIANAAPILAVTHSNINGFVGFSVSNVGTWRDVPDDLVSLSASLGNVTKNGDGTWRWSYTAASPLSNELVTITATDKDNATSTATFTVTTVRTQVTGKIESNRSTAVYGDDGIQFSVQVAGPKPGDPIPVGQIQLQINGFDFGAPVPLQSGGVVVSAPRLNAGNHSIDALFTDPSGIYSDAKFNLTQTITKATIEVRAANAEMQVGDPLPGFAAEFSGFVLPDTAASVLSGTPSLTVDSSAVNTPGVYPIVAAIGSLSLSSGNYALQFTNGQLTVRIKPTITLSLAPSTMPENGSTRVTVTRNTPNDQPLQVELSVDKAGQIEFSEKVTIPAGQSSFSFDIKGINDDFVAADRDVVIQAKADGFVSGSTTLKVTEDDSPTLKLELAAQTLSEKGGTTVGTIKRNTPTDSALVVQLSIDPPNVATMDATVTIPAGLTSANFTITARDNLIYAGNVMATIKAKQLGFADAQATFEILEDDPRRPWHNFVRKEDVNGDGQVTAVDALIVIDLLNKKLGGELPDQQPGTGPISYPDVNNDRNVSPIDVLTVIDFLNKRGGTGSGEGEARHHPAADFSMDMWMNDIAEDVHRQRVRLRKSR